MNPIQVFFQPLGQPNPYFVQLPSVPGPLPPFAQGFNPSQHPLNLLSLPFPVHPQATGFRNNGFFPVAASPDQTNHSLVASTPLSSSSSSPSPPQSASSLPNPPFGVVVPSFASTPGSARSNNNSASSTSTNAPAASGNCGISNLLQTAQVHLASTSVSPSGTGLRPVESATVISANPSSPSAVVASSDSSESKVQGTAGLVLPPRKSPTATSTPTSIEGSVHCPHSGCGKTLSNIYSLRRHMKTHANEHPFECTICSTRFTEKSSLKRHYIVHANKKPHQCTFDRCTKKFIDRCNLRKHLEAHQRNSFQCFEPNCMKLFPAKEHLATHFKSRHGQQASKSVE